MRWSHGDTIVIQEVWRGRLWAARPVTVVADDGDELILWCPKGTVRKVPVTPPSRRSPGSRPEWFAERLSRCDWELADSTWDVSTLWILRQGEWHSVWVSFRDGGDHLGYYINLQEPYRRTEVGIRTMDLMLDVIVDYHGSWRWKDQDDFEMLTTRQLIDAAVAQRVWDEATRAVRSCELREAPFDGTWTAWRPDRAWAVPRLPRGWDVVGSVTE